MGDVTSDQAAASYFAMTPTSASARLTLISALLFAPASLAAAAPGLFGDWRTPDGSVLRTTPCAQALCIKIISVTPTAPGTLDQKNPDPALRNRSLCNLQIGRDFSIAGDTQATNGHLYDPESGKTYKGNIDLEGDTLKLRGYLGVSLFGRTEIWHRTVDVKPCS